MSSARSGSRPFSLSLGASARHRDDLSGRRKLLVYGLAGTLLGGGLVASAPAFAADAAPLSSGQFDFTTASGAVATGYTADRALGYDAARGFGWVLPGSSTPVDMGLNTRTRTSGTDQRLKTVDIMQGSGVSSQPVTAASWEVGVVNGTYDVTVGVGDYGYYDSTHRITSEGVRVANDIVTTAAAPFQAATAVVTVTDGKLTLDPTGGVNTKIAYVTFAPHVTPDTTKPVVSLAASGTQQGTPPNTSYVDAATVTLTATDDVGVATRTYTVDGGAAQPYTAPFSLGPGTHTVTGSATDAAGNVSTTATLTVPVVATPAGTGKVTVANTDVVPGADRMVLSRIQTPETGSGLYTTGACCIPANQVHDRGTYTITNTGTGPLVISSIVATSGFAVTPSAPLPRTLAAGASMSALVTFTYTSTSTATVVNAQAIDGTVTISSNDATTPTKALPVGGLWQQYSEKEREPSLALQAKAFGWTTSVPSPALLKSTGGQATPLGDEVLSGLWMRSDPVQPVVITQLSAYHTQGNTARFSTYLKPTGTASPTLVSQFTHNSLWGQSVLPPRAGSTTSITTANFSPAATAVFGFKLDSEWSEDSRNDATPDLAAGCSTAIGCGHHIRVFPVYDKSGALVPNTYFVGMDYSGINYDFQDNVYLLQNVMPATASSPSSRAVLPGAAGTALDFNGPVTGTLPDAAGAGTGFRGVQVNSLGDQSQPSRLAVANGALNVLAYGTATAGSNSATDNTMVNALQLPFDASVEPFTVSSRLVGPLSTYASTGRAAGIYVGLNQDDFVKYQVVGQSNQPRLQLLSESAGAITQVALSSPLPTTTGALDLALVGNPLDGTVTALYRTVTNGTPSPWTALGTYSTSGTASGARFGKVFARTQQAGLYANAKGSTEYTASFDSFAVAPGDPRSPDGAAVVRYDTGRPTGSFTDSQGRVWSGDAGTFTPSTAIVENPDSKPIANAQTVDAPLYWTYRGNTNQANQALRTISYALPVPAGTGPVRLRLYLAERYSGNNAAGKRVFSITAEGRQVAADFDTFAAAGGQNTAVTLTVPNLTVTDGVLNLDMKASKDYAGLNAVEVVREGGAAVVDTTPPPVPTGTAAVVNSGTATVTWNAVSAADLAGYQVFRSTTGTVDTTGTPVSGPTLLGGTSFTDPGLAPGTYAYAVVAVDTSGNRSAASTVASVSVADTVAPAVPGSPTATSTATAAEAQAQLSWGAVADADLAGYRVYRATSTPVSTVPGNRVSGAALVTGTSFTDPTVQPGTTYFYVVTAVDLTGNESAGSAAATTTVPVPDTTAPLTPATLTATVVATNVALSWTANVESDLAGYAVYRAAGTVVQTIGTPLSGTALLTSASFTDTTATPGTDYTYVVVAVDTAGNRSAASDPASATVPTTGGAPLSLKVDYSDPATSAAAGYVRDFGQPFGLRDNGMSFGWVVSGSSTPLDLTADGRVRTTGVTTTDPRLLTFVHTQQNPANPLGAWELAVPNGTYTVTAAVGDAGKYYDSTHALAAEGLTLVSAFVPTSTNRIKTGTATVTVTDGRLTITSTGTNTKVDYLDVTQVS
jgi:hypothetical protein